jgi:hypothetical protein
VAGSLCLLFTADRLQQVDLKIILIYLLPRKLDDINVNRARTVDITFGDYQYTKNGIRFSTYRRITVAERSKLDIEAEFKQVEFNQPQNFSFKIPTGYKRL